ncbi:MAG TPA: hypothetical protein VKT70_07575, partial [Stellaceae bacterium]|nr:hypothetical protein [Stellaceae bacterium]
MRRLITGLLMLALSVAPAEAASLTLTVAPGARQAFLGFGASLIPDRSYRDLSPERRALLARLLWHDLHFKVLRVWADMASGTREAQSYLDSGIINDAVAAGASELLLAPEGQGAPDVARYTDAVTALLGFYRDHGVTFNATGVANEPGDGAAAAVHMPQHMVALIEALRTALDHQGLGEVKIIAPELANADAMAVDWLERLKASPAWRGLGGFSTHSYNMAATEAIASRLKGEGKEYWITEAGDNGPEEPENALIAAGLAARVLNDLNHFANYWIFFIGYLAASPDDNATRIIAYDSRREGDD